MKAAIYNGSRQVQIGGCTARAPGPGEVQIQVAYCGVCGTDLHLYLGHMDRRVVVPHIPGHEMSGVIAEIGADVQGWRPGDRVAVRPLNPCGRCPACKAGHLHICHDLKFLGVDTPGAFQESWTVPAHTLHRVPDSLPLDLAAMIEPLAVACHDVRLGDVRPGDCAVVIGGGPIGVLIGLVARHSGARVILAEINPFRLGLARELGLDAVNPREASLTEYVGRTTEGAGADVVFEVTGTPAGASIMTEVARTRGRIVVVGLFTESPKVDLFRCFFRELSIQGARVYEEEDFERAITLATSGALPLARLISARLDLDDLPATLVQMAAGADLMKVLFRCGT